LGGERGKNSHLMYACRSSEKYIIFLPDDKGLWQKLSSKKISYQGRGGKWDKNFNVQNV